MIYKFTLTKIVTLIIILLTASPLLFSQIVIKDTVTIFPSVTTENNFTLRDDRNVDSVISTFYTYPTDAQAELQMPASGMLYAVVRGLINDHGLDLYINEGKIEDYGGVKKYGPYSQGASVTFKIHPQCCIEDYLGWTSEGDIYFLGDGMYVIVLTEVSVHIFQASLDLTVVNINHFDVESFPQEINYEEAASISINGIDDNGVEVWPEYVITEQMSLSITADPPGYGHFEGQTGSGPFEFSYVNTPTFIADGTVPDVATTITFTVSSVDDPSKTGTGSLVVQPPNCPNVILSDSTISPGDTIEVTVKRKFYDETTSDYRPGTTFNIGIFQGEAYGNLLANDELSPWFSNIGMPIKFVASDSVLVDDILVSIRATPIPPNNGGGGGASRIFLPGREDAHSKEGKPSSIALRKSAGLSRKDLETEWNQFRLQRRKLKANKDESTIKGSNRITNKQEFLKTLDASCNPGGQLKIEAASILLGETKYYYVKSLNGKQTIEETTDLSKTPDIATEAVWGNDPVTRVTKDIATPGKRIGVYWEKKKPDGTSLPAGIIRLIGRYWTTDSVYKAELSITYNTEVLKKIITVTKPGKLFDSNVYDADILNVQYNMTKGIKNNDINIDELCIEYGGKIGISPQVIKAQMFQESDRTGGRLNPSYRYEPWQDYHEFARGKYAEDYKKQPFYITGAQTKPMGEGKEVPLSPPGEGSHKNVKPIYYPQEPITIADFVIANWGKYIDQSKIEVVGSDALTKKFKKYFDEWSDAYLLGTGKGIYQIATELIQQDIKELYTDYAQTRKAASYGLVQIMYTTAKDPLGFNRGKTISTSVEPENLNDETIEMPFYEKFIQENLRLQFGSKDAYVPERNWPNGWETTWKKSFKRYNDGEKYPGSVFNHSKKFYPQSK